MARGVGASARSWGRAGVAALALAACGSTASPPPPPAPPAVLGLEASAPAPVPVAAAAPAVPTGSGVWAVVVGIDDYQRGADLRSAGNDAADVDAALAAYGVPDGQRLHLRNRDATADALRRSLAWLVDRAGPDATAVVFFAGHVRKLARGSEALVGSDGGLVGDSEVAEALAGLQAARTWLVFASCYGGGFTEALAPGRILTAAAPADRMAYESAALRRSYLVEYLVRRAMLGGEAGTSVEASFAWAARAIARDHPGREPVQVDRLAGDLVLGHPPTRSAPTAAVPVEVRAPVPTTTTSMAPPGGPSEGCGFTMGTVVHCPAT